MEGFKIFSRAPDVGSLSFITVVENLIEVVGSDETRFLSSLTETDYQRLVAALDGLIDIVRENENHILASLMDFIGTLIEKYEDEHVPELVEMHQSDNADIDE